LCAKRDLLNGGAIVRPFQKVDEIGSPSIWYVASRSSAIYGSGVNIQFSSWIRNREERLFVDTMVGAGRRLCPYRQSLALWSWWIVAYARGSLHHSKLVVLLDAWGSVANRLLIPSIIICDSLGIPLIRQQ
jgi:hypothetical protein